MADDLLERERTMQRDVLLVATAAVSLVNGQSFSPLFDPVLILIRPFVAQLITSPLLLLYLTSLFISLMTLCIAGIPAAIWERVRGHKESTPVSIGIWLVATILLTIPAIRSWLDQ
jgi:ABC-type transport system involved in multi-copper enzyme maturation permease subunit